MQENKLIGSPSKVNLTKTLEEDGLGPNKQVNSMRLEETIITFKLNTKRSSVVI